MKCPVRVERQREKARWTCTWQLSLSDLSLHTSPVKGPTYYWKKRIGPTVALNYLSAQFPILLKRHSQFSRAFILRVMHGQLSSHLGGGGGGKVIKVKFFNLTHLIEWFRSLNQNLLISCWVCIRFANCLITILPFFTWNKNELFYVQDYI